MSEYTFDDLVVGGIQQHRFFVINEIQQNTPYNNRVFNIDIGDWLYNGTAVIERVADSDSQFGDYCLKITDDSAAAHEYAYRTISLTGSGGNRQFVVYFWAKGDSTTTHGCVAIESDDSSITEIDSKNIALTENWKPYYMTFILPEGTDATEFHIILRPSYIADDVAQTGVMYADNVNCFEVDFDIELDVRSRFDQEWEKVLDAEYE